LTKNKENVTSSIDDIVFKKTRQITCYTSFGLDKTLKNITNCNFK